MENKSERDLILEKVKNIATEIQPQAVAITEEQLAVIADDSLMKRNIEGNSIALATVKNSLIEIHSMLDNAVAADKTVKKCISDLLARTQLVINENPELLKDLGTYDEFVIAKAIRKVYKIHVAIKSAKETKVAASLSAAPKATVSEELANDLDALSAELADLGI